MQRIRVREVLRRVACVAIFATACGMPPEGADEADQQAQALIGGEPALGADWDVVVWLDGGCTGTVIDSGTIVFAAHCGTAHVYAYAGTKLPLSWARSEGPDVELGPGTRRFELDRCVVRTTPEIGSGEDIGVCTSLDELPVSKIGLPSTGSELSPLLGADVLLVGYGPAYGARPSHLQRDLAWSVVNDVGSELQIGDAQKGTCPGDSGGPALAPREDGGWTLVGVLSSGKALECGTGWYTPVSSNVDWLQSAPLQDASAASGCNVRSGVPTNPALGLGVIALLLAAGRVLTHPR